MSNILVFNPCEETADVYKDYKSAANALGMNASTLKSRLDKENVFYHNKLYACYCIIHKSNRGQGYRSSGFKGA